MVLAETVDSSRLFQSLKSLERSCFCICLSCCQVQLESSASFLQTELQCSGFGMERDITLKSLLAACFKLCKLSFVKSVCCVCVCVCVCVCARMLRIVSTDLILHFISTLIINIKEM